MLSNILQRSKLLAITLFLEILMYIYMSLRCYLSYVQYPSPGRMDIAYVQNDLRHINEIGFRVKTERYTV